MAKANQALEKAYDAGQAAQAGEFPESVCPFEEDTPEWMSWMDGYAAPLAEKWETPGRRITLQIEEGR